MSNPFDKTTPPSAMAALIVQAIEAGNSDTELLSLMAQWAWTMGGTAPLAHMTPQGRLLYLLALMQAWPR